MDWSDAKRADFAIKLCDRKHSLGGADGILYVTKAVKQDQLAKCVSLTRMDRLRRCAGMA